MRVYPEPKIDKDALKKIQRGRNRRGWREAGGRGRFSAMTWTREALGQQ